MEVRTRPYFEVRLEKDDVVIHVDLPLTPMDRVGGIDLNEVSRRDELRAIGLGERLRGGWRRKYIREEEKPECDAEPRPNHAAQEKNRETPPETTHAHPHQSLLPKISVLETTIA